MAALAGACQGPNPDVDSSGALPPMAGGTGSVPCTPGHAGCPCNSNGAEAACGTMLGQFGNYVTCAIGRATCEGGSWGACVGTSLVTKSVASATIGSGGLRIQASLSKCNIAGTSTYDPCDPDCAVLSSGAGDVDAAGVVPAPGGEGGVTLAPANAPTCLGLECQVAQNCPTGQSTTLTGVVRDPAGNNPLYNAYVYVPVDPSGSLPAFSAGASCDTCSGAGSLDAVAVAQTGPDGSFTLTGVPSTDLAPGSPIPLVVQLGKWRREVMLTSVPQCQTTKVATDDARLPRNQSDGFGGRADLPKVAIASGSSDPFECLLLKMGIDPAEFEPGLGTRRIDYYVANGLDFDPPAPDYSSLVGSSTTLQNYDIVILPCEGKEDDGNDQYADQVSAYTMNGGRVFTTHFGYTWLATPTNGSANPVNPATGNPNPFFGVAKWNLNPHPGFVPPVTAVIDSNLPGNQPFAKGQAFASWLLDVNASTTLGQLQIQQARDDVATVVPATTDEWMHNQVAPNEPYYFSFDTPLGAGSADGGTAACGRVGYSDFHVSSTALVDPTAGGACNTDSDCGFTANCVPATLGVCTPPPCATDADCVATYSCQGAVTGSCAPQPCASEADCVTGICLGGGTCGCAQDRDCSSGSCTAGVCAPSAVACAEDMQCGNAEHCAGGTPGACRKSCTVSADCAGEQCSFGQCVGCSSAADCKTSVCTGATPAACSASSNSFPLACRQGPLTPQESALEFMLLDLTACISPTSAPPAPAVPPPPVYDPATFTEDFSAAELQCPMGSRAAWRHLDWQAIVPDTASIVFTAETTDAVDDAGLPDFSAAQVVLLADDTTTTPFPGAQVFIDTGADPGSTGRFNLAMPPVISKSYLRVMVQMNPTADRSMAPTLLNWQVWADCVASE